jgi:pimeloyl-ACP methyl ester carboxylesterase
VSKFVTVNGGRLEYLDWGGDGPPLVFLAGLGSTAHIFNDLAPEFDPGKGNDQWFGQLRERLPTSLSILPLLCWKPRAEHWNHVRILVAHFGEYREKSS